MSYWLGGGNGPKSINWAAAIDSLHLSLVGHQFQMVRLSLRSSFVESLISICVDWIVRNIIWSSSPLSSHIGFEDISIKFPARTQADNQLREIDYNSPVEMQITDKFYSRWEIPIESAAIEWVRRINKIFTWRWINCCAHSLNLFSYFALSQVALYSYLNITKRF